MLLNVIHSEPMKYRELKELKNNEYIYICSMMLKCLDGFLSEEDKNVKNKC